jgi:hypothetical protein
VYKNEGKKESEESGFSRSIRFFLVRETFVKKIIHPTP